MIWKWLFSLPIDEIGLKAKTILNFSFYGLKWDGENQFEEGVEGYKDWTDEERKAFQKAYYLAILGRDTRLLPNELN
jgi:hypothetical protein